MNITLGDWVSHLEQVHPAQTGGTPHGWICAVNRTGEMKVEVLSSWDYEKARRKHYCRKLSLHELIDLSRQFMEERICNGNQIHDFVYLTDLFATNIKTELSGKFTALQQNPRAFSSIRSTLTALSERSATKRQAAKIASLWGWIQWHLWSWWYAPSSRLDKIGRIAQSPPSFEGVRQSAISALRDRILLNVQEFEDAIEIQDRLNEGLFSSSKAAKKAWHPKYSADKYRGPVSDFADGCRTRVAIALNLWEWLEGLSAGRPVEEEESSGNSGAPFRISAWGPNGDGRQKMLR